MLTGVVLWYSQRDCNGIIRDILGNEFYFDISVLKKKYKDPKPGDKVKFDLNDKIKDCNCAHKVSLLTNSK